MLEASTLGVKVANAIQRAQRTEPYRFRDHEAGAAIAYFFLLAFLFGLLFLAACFLRSALNRSLASAS